MQLVVGITHHSNRNDVQAVKMPEVQDHRLQSFDALRNQKTKAKQDVSCPRNNS